MRSSGEHPCCSGGLFHFEKHGRGYTRHYPSRLSSHHASLGNCFLRPWSLRIAVSITVNWSQGSGNLVLIETQAQGVAPWDPENQHTSYRGQTELLSLNTLAISPHGNYLHLDKILFWQNLNCWFLEKFNIILSVWLFKSPPNSLTFSIFAEGWHPPCLNHVPDYS